MKKIAPPKTPKKTKPKINWHTIEATSVLLLRWPATPPGLPSETRRVVRQILEGYTRAELIAMFANGIESFSWEEG